MIKFGATLLAMLIAVGVNVAMVDLHIMETTDLHSSMTDFDYYKDTVAEKFGLVCMVSLIDDARNEVKNSVLIDNDNLIQGSPLADCMSTKGLKAGGIHPVCKALDTLDYAVGTPGNHEFNYGLGYLRSVLVRVKFPYVNTSVINTGTKQPMFTPYLIKDTGVIDKDGKKQTLKIGYIGVVPPQIVGWDKANLSGKVTVNDIIEIVHRYMPEIHERDANVVVVLARSGLSTDPYKVMAENSVYYLNETPGVNAIMFGHVHAVFLGRDLADIEGADTAKSTLNGVPVVMPGIWGDHLDAIDLQLSSDSGR